MVAYRESSSDLTSYDNFNMRAVINLLRSTDQLNFQCIEEIRRVFSELIKRTRGATFLFLYRAVTVQLALGP